VEKLETYPAEDLLDIIQRSARLLGCGIADRACGILAERCRGTPRYANRFLRRIRDVAQYHTGWNRRDEPPLVLTEDFVREGLDRLGIDAQGLDRVDRKILEILLAQNEPVGVKTLAVSVGEEERTIEDVHEPYLIQKGMLVKTPRGRRASALAFELYKARGHVPSQGEFTF
jgi:Holliday junction DNA helicase RuvB